MHPHLCATFQHGCISISARAFADGASAAPPTEQHQQDTTAAAAAATPGALQKDTPAQEDGRCETNKQTNERKNRALAPLWLTNRTRHFPGSGDMKSDRGKSNSDMFVQTTGLARLPRQTRSSPHAFPWNLPKPQASLSASPT